MNDYTPNSNKFKEEQKANAANEKRAEKVVRGAVKTKKKSSIQKFADVFIKEDVTNVKNYIVDDIVIPTIRDTIWSVLTNSLEMFLYPGGSKRRSRSGADYVSYRDYSGSSRRDSYRREPDSRPRFDGEDLVFETRGDAEAVLREMNHMLNRFGLVRVGDLYDMADRTAPYTSNNYGWTSLNRVDVVRVRDGYILKLPKATPID